MTKNNENLYIIKSMTRDMLTYASKMHKAAQAANQAAKDGNTDGMQEPISTFLPLLKEMQGIATTINKFNTVEPSATQQKSNTAETSATQKK